jgi:YesN/AraC family two-component response regulator
MVVEEAVNCAGALQKIQESPPHLIFMDIQLPEMNGFQLTQKIKNDFPHIHVAIITGYDFPEYRQAALQSGADCLFSKESLNWNEVKAFIESIPFPPAN